tara:strand:- start:491 stop:685 length:195 start_codon:yes stop_codon:yes gene_type:complete
MDFKTYKIEENKDGSWVNATSTNPNGSFTDEYTGLTEDQTQDVIDYFVTVGISSTNLRATEETS